MTAAQEESTANLLRAFAVVPAVQKLRGRHGVSRKAGG